MFFSVNPPSLHADQPTLARFVLDRHAQGLPAPFRVSMYYHVGLETRSVGNGMKAVRTEAGVTGYWVSEVSHPPFEPLALARNSSIPGLPTSLG